jgi:hypothetical protein
MTTTRANGVHADGFEGKLAIRTKCDREKTRVRSRMWWGFGHVLPLFKIELFTLKVWYWRGFPKRRKLQANPIRLILQLC